MLRKPADSPAQLRTELITGPGYIQFMKRPSDNHRDLFWFFLCGLIISVLILWWGIWIALLYLTVNSLIILYFEVKKRRLFRTRIWVKILLPGHEKSANDESFNSIAWDQISRFEIVRTEIKSGQSSKDESFLLKLIKNDGSMKSLAEGPQSELRELADRLKFLTGLDTWEPSA